MHLGRKAVKALVVSALIAVPALVLTPTASADRNPLWAAVTLTDGGLCAGHIDFETIYGPNSQYFGLISNIVGVGPCSVEVAVNWRNLDSGASGTVRQTIVGTGGSGHQIAFSPGRGRISGTITTNAAHKPGYFEFVRTAA